SDSSYRFERGVDLRETDDASLRAAQLLTEIAGAQARGMYFAQGTTHVPLFPLDGRTVTLRPERCRQLLGLPVADARIDEILTGFGLVKTDDGWRIPSYRQDLTREADLIEEVARVVGLDQVEGRVAGRCAPASPSDRAYDFALRLRRRLAALGFQEARHVSLVADAAARTAYFPLQNPALRLKNPLTEEGVALRPSLLPGLLATAGFNARMGAADLRLFELGRVFAAGGEPEETTALALLLSGASQPPSWRGAPRAADMHDLRGVLEDALGRALEIRPLANENAALPLAASLHLGGRAVGHLGQLAPAQARALDLSTRAPVLVAELNVPALQALADDAAAERKFQPLPRFPSITRDLAVIVPETLPHGEIAAALQGKKEPLLAGVALFDVFTDPAGAKVPAGKKSLAYSLTYRAPDRTLKADEVSAAHDRLKAVLAASFDVVFRE
ncbi:MAG: phenylalanine--tRNA ligase subunit beta, partial [Verrucomicrobia bacterium]|nr:phenylalanine--tRNA ligase subunit beta [Verrucomicrobiota bacterium]